MIGRLSFLLWITVVSSYRILVYSPRMMQSHVNFMARIANVLAENGHEVTVVDSVLRYDIGNALAEDIKQIIEVQPSPQVTDLLKTEGLPDLLWNSKPTPEDQKSIMEGLGHIHRLQCVHLIQNTTIIEQLRLIQFDFAIHEVFDACGVGVIEAANIHKSIIVSSTGPMDIVPWALGMVELKTMPALLSDYGNGFKWWNIRRNLKFIAAMLNFHEMQETMISPLFKSKYGVTKSFIDIMRESNVLFYNIHERCDAARLIGRRNYDIGGIALIDPKPLTDEYMAILSDKRPVVLVSFGTAATSAHMPYHLKMSILKTMKAMDNVIFIWKYEKEDEFSETKMNATNVIFKKFFPQTDLLNSGNISLFITHCGQNSLLESFQSGTRVVAVPLFGDQHRNAKLAEENGLIDILQKQDLANPKKLRNAIEKGLSENIEMSKNLDHISSLLVNARKNAEETLLIAVEKTYFVSRPLNFFKYPRLYHPQTIIRLIDFVTILILTLILMIIIKFISCKFFNK